MSRADLDAQRVLSEALGTMDVLVKITGSRPDSRAALGTIRLALATQAPVPAPIEGQSDLSKAVLTAIYRCCQAGASPERLHAAVMAIFDAAQAPVQGEPVANDAEDTARLDWLEQMGNEPEGILLHDSGDFTGRRGLGLRRIGRTLRAAIDAARKAET